MVDSLTKHSAGFEVRDIFGIDMYGCPCLGIPSKSGRSVTKPYATEASDLDSITFD
jgi:hypothetical protein